MIRCIIAKLSKDHSGWGEKSRLEKGISSYVETSWEAILVFKAKNDGSSVRVLVIEMERSGWIPNTFRRQDLNLEMKGQNWMDGGATD